MVSLGQFALAAPQSCPSPYLRGGWRHRAGMILVCNQLKKWCHLEELNACAAARVSANAVKVSSVQTVWRHLMVLKKQNGMWRGRAAILAACVCTGWVRLPGCLLGRRQVGKKKNHRVNDFGPWIPLGVFPVCCARSTALESIQHPYPAVVQGGRRDSLQEKVGLRLPARGWGRYWESGLCLWAEAAGGEEYRSTSSPLFLIICSPPVLHPSL